MAKIYKIPLANKKVADGIFSSDIFEPDRKVDDINEKVIMVMGGTGVGKTALINRMINYILNVHYSDPYRFQSIVETENPMLKSQTTDIHKYTIHHKKFKNINFPL